MNWGLRKFDTIQVATIEKPVASLDVWLGKKNKIDVYVKENIYLTVPKRKKKTIKAVLEYNGPVLAPIKKGDKIGTLNVYQDNELIKETNLYSNENIKRSNIFARLLKSLNYLVWGDA